MNSERDGASRLVLTGVRVAILVIVPLLLVVGRSTRTWPFTAWPMYSVRAPYPPDRIERVVLRVVTEDGRAHELPTARLLPVARTPAAIAIALDAAKSPRFSEERQWLVKRLRSELGRDDIRLVEVHLREWDLERSTVELIDPRKPDRESVVGSFEVAEMPQ